MTPAPSGAHRTLNAAAWEAAMQRVAAAAFSPLGSAGSGESLAIAPDGSWRIGLGHDGSISHAPARRYGTVGDVRNQLIANGPRCAGCARSYVEHYPAVKVRFQTAACAEYTVVVGPKRSPFAAPAASVVRARRDVGPARTASSHDVQRIKQLQRSMKIPDGEYRQILDRVAGKASSKLLDVIEVDLVCTALAAARPLEL